MMTKKPPLLDERLLARSLVFFYSEKLLFLKNYVTSEGVVSHNVLYDQQLFNARYKVSFQINICFE